MRPIYRGPAPAYDSVRGVRERVASDYKFFGGFLAARLGEYCSYCEVALGGSLAVEHIVAKSTQPQVENRWPNFLLACTNCNSTKGWKVYSVPQLEDYLWPCDTEAAVDSFEALEYRLDGTVVEVRPRGGIGAEWFRRAERTIELYALNRVRDDDPKASDRRVANRTQAWQRAVILADRLQDYYAPYTRRTDRDAAVTEAGQDAGINLLEKQITETALATGFWSVWMTVFTGRTFINDDVRQSLLCRLFVRTFPQTNFTVPGHYTPAIPTGEPRMPRE